MWNPVSGWLLITQTAWCTTAAVVTEDGAVSLKMIADAPETIDGSAVYVNTNRRFTRDQILNKK